MESIKISQYKHNVPGGSIDTEGRYNGWDLISLRHTLVWPNLFSLYFRTENKATRNSQVLSEVLSPKWKLDK